MRIVPYYLLLGSVCVVPPCLGEQLPSMKLLQFLGEWQDEQGGFVDPFDYSIELDEPKTIKKNTPEQSYEEPQTDEK